MALENDLGEGPPEETEEISSVASPTRKRKRPFLCQFCAKQFTRNEHLQRHERLREY